MRIKSLLFATFLLIGSFVNAQNDCNIYYPMKKGAKFQITEYTSSNKVSTVSDFEVVNIENTSEGTVGTLRASVREGKSKKLESQDFRVICKDNSLYIDFETLIGSEIFKQLGNDISYEINGIDLQWPTDIAIGKDLPDAQMSMQFNMAGMSLTTTVQISNRKVIGKESVTTKAGTFDCYVVTYDTDVSMMGRNMTTNAKQWISKGVGLVKQEDYSKGKMESHSELTLFSL